MRQRARWAYERGRVRDALPWLAAGLVVTAILAATAPALGGVGLAGALALFATRIWRTSHARALGVDLLGAAAGLLLLGTVCALGCCPSGSTVWPVCAGFGALAGAMAVRRAWGWRSVAAGALTAGGWVLVGPPAVAAGAGMLLAGFLGRPR